MFSDRDLIFRAPEHSILEFAKGGFAQRILIALRAEPEHPGQLEFLNKVLAAARLNLEKDTLWVEIQADEPVSILPAIKEKHAEHILVFGYKPVHLGIAADIPFYQPQTFYGATFLFADALSVLEPDKAKKGLLWQALQQIFL